jgi:integrase
MAQLEVYGGERDEYFSFITPEAYIALKDYMDFRELHGEKITGESWLIRDTWQKIDKRHGHNIGLAINPKRLDSEGIRKLIYDAWKVQGVTIKKTDSENRNHEFKSSHGFRKFFETHAMQVMYSSNVELLMGHSSSMGLKKNYYKPTEKMLQDDYVKAVNLLTLNNTKLKLEKQIEDQNTKNTETITNISDELLYLRKEVEFLKNKL